MQNRFTVFQRGAVFYSEDQTTGQQKSLRTRDEAEARRIVQAKNDAVALPQMNLVMAKTYLSAQNPKMITRTWADVLERFCDRSNANTQMRHERVVRTKPMQFLKCKRLSALLKTDKPRIPKCVANPFDQLFAGRKRFRAGLNRRPAAKGEFAKVCFAMLNFHKLNQFEVVNSRCPLHEPLPAVSLFRAF